MATNLAIDDKLINAAVKLGGFKSKKDAVNAALDEFVRRQMRLKAIEAFGTFDFDPAYDYKALRKAKRA
jgi:Arc/MetJ family transcription regulator